MTAKSTTHSENGRARVLVVLGESTRPLPNVGTKRGGLYVLANGVSKALRVTPAPACEPKWRDGPNYTGEKPMPVRPGALDFLDAPSVQGGERIERRRPMLISAREA